MDFIAHFREKGWFVLDLLDKKPLFETRLFLEEKLRAILGIRTTLEEYHHHVDDDTRHTDVQVALTDAYRKGGFGPKIIESQLASFRSLLGLDLFVQAHPYLRITRPFKPQDNIGYHRDTFYGGSPFELSVLVPFVSLAKEESLEVLSGSHVHAESLYPTTQKVSEEVSKGSEKHQLGFLYAPKVMDSAIEKRMEAIPLQLGQALVFSLSTVHGSLVNRGKISRFSSDIRVMHALAPVDLSLRPTYYKPLCYSEVTKAAKRYFFANEERRDNVELELCDTAPHK